MTRRQAYITASAVLAVAAVTALALIGAGHRLVALVPIAVVAVAAEVIRRTADAMTGPQDGQQ